MNPKYTIDLHMHSMLSDGKETPVEVVDTAKRFGLKRIVLTDHNTVHPNIEKLREYAASRGIDMPFTGCEATVNYYNRDGVLEGQFHMLVFGEDDRMRDFRFLEEITHFNDWYNEVTFEELKRFNDAGYELSFDEAFMYDVDIAPMEKHDKGSERHIIKCIAKKLGVSYDEFNAKVEHLHTARLYTPRGFIKQLAIIPDAKEFIALCREVGLVTVIAHPSWIDNVLPYQGGRFPLEKDLEIVKDLIDHGLDGLEVCHQEVPDNYALKLRAIAKEHGLLTTGGSDYHAEPDYGQHVTEYGTTEEEFARLEALVHERAANARKK